MGTYFNPGNESFKKAVNSKIYVDKSGLIKELNDLLGTEFNCISLSHARRFGKSQAAGMIDAYYSIGSDSKDLFSKLEIAQDVEFEEHLNKYNVIHMDMSSMADFHKDDLVEHCLLCLYDEFKSVYPDLNYNRDIAGVLTQIYKASGRKFVIIIDEWDCVVRNQSERPELVHKYLQFLHSLFKSEESKAFLALAYITGILPIKKIKDESALNNFDEYTMINSKRFTKYFGFTEGEVKSLCREYDMDFDSVKNWYNGYLINGMHMYNPNSVCRSMINHDYDSYWKNTSSFGTINTFIALNYDGLKEDILSVLSGNRVEVDVQTFQNDLSVVNGKDDALTALIHLGYLAYDADNSEVFLPNYEVAEAYKSALKTGEWSEIAESLSQCEKLLKATIKGDADEVAKWIEISHDAYSSILTYNNEASLSAAIMMAYYTARRYYNVIREFPSGKGFADIVMIPRKGAGNKPALVIELKWDKSAAAAISQIKDRRYQDALAGYSDEVLLVGISYDKDSTNKNHECVIERWRL